MLPQHYPINNIMHQVITHYPWRSAPSSMAEWHMQRMIKGLATICKPLLICGEKYESIIATTKIMMNQSDAPIMCRCWPCIAHNLLINHCQSLAILDGGWSSVTVVDYALEPYQKNGRSTFINPDKFYYKQPGWDLPKNMSSTWTIIYSWFPTYLVWP